MSTSAGVRASAKHPIIDSDGHQIETVPLVFDYLRAEAGEAVAARITGVAVDGHLEDTAWFMLSQEERHQRRCVRPAWFAVPARNTKDLATAMYPALMRERMDEMGLDVSVLFPTAGLAAVHIADEEVRRATVRAINKMKADMFAGHKARLVPVATIPMHTPQEAIDELEFAARKLGMRAVMMASFVRRPIAAAVQISPAAARYSYWLDTYGIDSEHNYDPVWAKCVELKVSPTFHSHGIGWGSRATPSNYIYNHLGNFASSAHAIARGLIFGGITKRFPSLTFGFMEGGVAWARSLYSDLISHWQKRNWDAVQIYDPSAIDREVFLDLSKRYGGKLIEGREEEVLGGHQMFWSFGQDAALADEWASSGIRSAEDIRDIFTKRFFFGCEGDDPLNLLAFDTKGSPFGAKLPAIYGSDLGHWDLPDMSEAAHEAYELVEEGILSDADFRDLVFTNPVRFWTSTNPNFFQGTIVESHARDLAQAR